MLKLALGLVVMLVAVARHADAQAKPDLIAPGKLTYGVAATFAPFEYQKDGKLVGFDIEFIDAVGKKLGLTPVPLNIDFAGLIPALLGNRVDIINSGMYINPKRAEQVDFIPYMKIGDDIVVRKGNPLNINSRADLCGHKIAVTLGGIEEIYAREDIEACRKAGKPGPTVMTLPTAQDSALSVRQGRADALFNSSPGAAQMINELPDVFQTAGETFQFGTQIGIAVRKGDAAMAEAIGKAVRDVVADGNYVKLLQKYNLPVTGSIF
jgi:polar amino acid transport system substrate-binding protein